MRSTIILTFVVVGIFQLISPCLALQSRDYYIIGGAAGGVLILVIIACCCCCQGRKSKSKPKFDGQRGNGRNMEPYRETPIDRITIVNEYQPAVYKQQQVNQVNYFAEAELRRAPSLPASEILEIRLENDVLEVELKLSTPPPSPTQELNDLIHRELQQNIFSVHESPKTASQASDEQTASVQSKKSNDLVHPASAQILYAPSESQNSSKADSTDDKNRQELQESKRKSQLKESNKLSRIESIKDLYAPTKIQHQDDGILNEKEEQVKELPNSPNPYSKIAQEELPQKLMVTEGQGVMDEFQRMPRIKKINDNYPGGGLRDSLEPKRRQRINVVRQTHVEETLDPSYADEKRNQSSRRKPKRASKKGGDLSSPQQVLKGRSSRQLTEEQVQLSDSDSDKKSVKAERIQPRKHWKSIFNQA